MYYTHTLNRPWKLWRYKLQTQITQSRKATNSRAFLCGIGHPPADLVPDCSLLIFQPLLFSDFCSTVQSGTKYGPKQLFPISASGMSPKPLSFAPPVPRCGNHDALIYRPGATLCLANWLGFCFSFFTMASRRGVNYREKMRLALTTFEQAWCVSQKPQYT